MILAFDTSSAHCAIGICGDDTKITSAVHPMVKGQAEALFPLIETMLANADKTWTDISRIGVGVGPGNFTGVRLSVSAARGLALSLGVPAIGVNRFDVMAHKTSGAVTIALDARRSGVYIQHFMDSFAQSAPELIMLDDLADHTLGKTVIGDIEQASQFDQNQFIPNLLDLAAMSKPDVPRPAPLYLRSADAALPSDPVPTILP